MYRALRGRLTRTRRSSVTTRRQANTACAGISHWPATTDSVDITAGGAFLQVHRIKHDPGRKHGAFTNAASRLSCTNAA